MPVHVTRVPYGPRLEKPCLLDFPQNDIQTSLLSYRDEQSIQSSTIPDPGYQWESDKLTVRHHKREQEVSPFPAGDHKAQINRCAQRHNKRRTEK